MTAPESPGPGFVDWTKPILWDGKPARVLATDIKGVKYPVLIAVNDDRQEGLVSVGLDGTTHDRLRVTNAPERVERWANVYGPGAWSVQHKSREDADLNGTVRVSLLHLTFEADVLVAVEIVPLEEGR